MHSLVLGLVLSFLIPTTNQRIYHEQSVFNEAVNCYFNAEFSKVIEICDSILEKNGSNVQVLDLKAAALIFNYQELEESNESSRKVKMLVIENKFKKTIVEAKLLLESMTESNTDALILSNLAMIYAREAVFFAKKEMWSVADRPTITAVRFAKKSLFQDPNSQLPHLIIGTIQLYLGARSGIERFLIKLVSDLDDEIEFDKDEGLNRLKIASKGNYGDFRKIEAKFVYGEFLIKEGKFQEALEVLAPFEKVFPRNYKLIQKIRDARKFSKRA